MAYHVEHLHSAQAVDDAINREGEGGRRLAIVRFGWSGHDDCLRFDAAMAAAAERVGPVAALIAVDIEEVQDFNAMYDLHKPCTIMFFYRYSYVDVRGFGSCAYINDWTAISGADEFAHVVGVVHKRASAGYRIVDFGHGV